MTFALFFGNRGLFPGWVIANARQEMQEACQRNGYTYLIMEEEATRHGAVETYQEGVAYARFLEQHAGEYDGVIVCLPNFGDENGVCAALEQVKVPILVQAYPDESGQMAPELRRDAYCGKLAVCNMLRQCGIPFSLTEQFAISPAAPAFDQDLHRFAAVCRTVNGMRRFRVGVFGARTTPFKTTRYDEVALQKKGITVETFDLSEVFNKMDSLSDAELQNAIKALSAYACFDKRDPQKLHRQAAFLAVCQHYITTYGLSAVAIRCWEEFECRYGISPCVSMSYLTEQGIPAACETDVNSAVMMRALSLAADAPVMLLDVNNNYGNDPQKCILFHCGVSPASRMTEQPHVCAHLSFSKFGCTGTVAGGLLDGPVTVGNIRTENGQLYAFLGEGALTNDPIDQNFFGTASVFAKESLPAMLRHMAYNGYKHHTVVAPGRLNDVVEESFTVYLGYHTTVI